MQSCARDDIESCSYAIDPHVEHRTSPYADAHIHVREIKQEYAQGLLFNEKHEAVLPLPNNNSSCAASTIESMGTHCLRHAPHYVDRSHIHGDEDRKQVSLLPSMRSSATDMEKGSQVSSPQVQETALVNERPMLNVKALCIDDFCDQHEDTVVDVCKVISESQTTQEPVKSSDPYMPRPALSRRKSPSAASTCQAELVKNVSFGSRSTSPPGTATVFAAAQEQPQPPIYHHQAKRQHSKKKIFSQTTPGSTKETSDGDDHVHCEDGPVQENYSLFRTRSGTLERKLSRLQSRRPQEQQREPTAGDGHGKKNRSMGEGSVSAGRYFDALKGPELEILKDSEEVLLPLDKLWPFLLRFPISSFGICLGLSSQAILWKVLATKPSMAFLHVPPFINFVLWCLALVALVVVFTTYTLKCVLYFEAVRREFQHPVRVNFFFAPWIVCMFLALGAPPSITTSIHPSLWCVFVTPLLILELKIYGQWLSGGQRRLSKVANPSTHLSLVGNFVSALLAAQIGWNEPAVFFWAVGCAHYLVLFVTLYQRLPTAEALPKELHPVFSLFIAAPSTASVAWEYIVGDFDRISRIAYFIAMFLYASLVVRVKFFCGFQFSVAWWAYTFPMTASAIATIHYSMEVAHPFTQVLAVILSVIATLMVMMVFISTILHFMWGSLFPNDIAIAITTRRHGRKHKGPKADVFCISASNKISKDLKADQLMEGSHCSQGKSRAQATLPQDGI